MDLQKEYTAYLVTQEQLRIINRYEASNCLATNNTPL